MSKVQTTILITEVILGCSVLAIGVGLIALGVFGLSHHIFQKYYEKGQQAQWEKDSRRFMDWSYWFSEDEATRLLIQNLARDGDVSAVRDKWRKDRTKTGLEA